MLYEHRGLETARILLHSTNVSEGYTRGRLDLTVEAVVHDVKRTIELPSSDQFDLT
jgi:hypothetical protein